MSDPKFELGPIQAAPTICDRCGRPLDEHPYVCPNSDGPKVVISADAPRHPKWQRVEPGTVIPAGQPYRVEFDNDHLCRAQEYVNTGNAAVVDDNDWFIDSSWKPPLVLPTTPTWGIAVHAKHGVIVGRFWLDGDEVWQDLSQKRSSYRAHSIFEFTPLTEEQVARIEAAR